MSKQVLTTTYSEEELESKLSSIVYASVKKVFKEIPAQEEERLMKPKEVAGMFDISLPTLSKWAKEGRVPSTKIRSRVFYKKSQIMEALESGIAKYKKD